jgi:hypothetical protein
MDGFDVKVGDHVYDLILGGGAVKGVAEDRITVVFNNGVTRVYSKSGVSPSVGQKRTLYWADPFEYVPPPSKDPTVRATLGHLYAEIARQLESFKGVVTARHNSVEA